MAASTPGTAICVASGEALLEARNVADALDGRARGDQIGALQQMVGAAEVEDFLAFVIDGHER
jgi:hypothetical protein